MGPTYPEVPTFKSSHVPITSSHHAYETHVRGGGGGHYSISGGGGLDYLSPHNCIISTRTAR